MNNHYYSRSFSSLLRLVSLCLFGIGGWLASDAQAQVAGRVFRDFNANGFQDTPISSTASAVGEPGFPGVTVTAYPITGSPVSVTTGVDGSYSFPNSGITGAGAKLRLEFSGLPSGVYSAAYGTATTGSGTSIQFVTAGSSATANYGVNYPGEYCDSSPILTVPCFVSGSATASGVAGEHVVVTFPYSASTTNTGTLAAPVPSNSINPTPIADAGQVGSVWGMAYQRETNRLFSAAFLKRHVGLGTGGLGGIYVTNNATGTTTNGTLYVDLEAAPFNLNLGQSLVGTRSTLPTTPTTSSTDPTTFSLIGAAGLGSMAISDDGTRLYVVDLFNRQLLVLSIGNPAKAGASLSASDLTQIALPATSCTNGVARPFAVAVYHGKVYVGVVCTGENSGATAANLSATIYEMDETTQTFSPSNVFTAPLNYPKGWIHAQQTALGSVWETWTSSFNTLNTTQLSATGATPVVFRTAQPQPILSDIDFTDNGDMVISLMDRAGHQLGYRQVSPTGGSTLYSGYIGGDLLRARKQGSSWVLESAGRVSSSTSGTLIGCGPTNAQGPGSGEFYCNDNYGTDNDGNGTVEEIHQETAQGGALIVPGTNRTVAIHMDPMTTWSGGTIWHSNTTGIAQRVYQLYRTIDNTGSQVNGTYGKANGLGLPVALCDPAPVEIGNRVWFDKNNDGIQDPDETPIASVTVGLYNSGTLVATAVTNSKGEYYFSSATGTNSTAVRYNLNLIRGGDYELRIPTTQTALASYLPSSPTDAGINDAIDNDFAVVGTNLVASLTVGMSGNNLHRFDAAVVCAEPVSPGLTSTSATCNGTVAQNNGTISIPANVTNANRYSLISGTITTGFAYSTATPMPTVFPATLVSNAPNAGATYTIRFYNNSNDCYVDEEVVVAPSSCTAPTPAQLLVVVGTPVCNSATNTYTATGMVSLSNAQAGTLSITDDGIQIASVSVTAGQTSVSFSVSGASGSNPVVPQVVAVLNGVSATTTYTKPASCTACQAPALVMVPQSQTTCVDGTAPVPISTSVISGSATTYQWYGPGSSTATVLNLPIGGATEDTYAVSRLVGDVAGQYHFAVVVTNGPESCSTVAYAQVIVNNRPDLRQLPISLCAGESIDLLTSFSVANGPLSQLRIYPTVDDLVSGKNQLTNTVVSLTSTTTYYVGMTNVAGCTWSDETNITVNPLPNAGADQALRCVDGAAPTSTTLTAISATSGQWSAAAGNPTPTTFGSVSGLSTSVNGMNAPGSYTFVFTTPQSCSDAIVVTVPICQTVCVQPIVVIASGDNQTVCMGMDSAPLVGSLISGSAVSYQWYGPSSTSTSAGASIAGANSLTFAASASLSVGTYYYTLVASTVSGSTCSSSAVAKLTVSPVPALTINSTTVCSGVPLSFTSFVQMGPTTTYSVHATQADAETNTNRIDPQQSFSVSAVTVYYIRGREINSNCITVQSLTLTPIDCTVPRASLGDKVFVDTNKNGIQDAGDTPLAGVTVTLISNATVIATTTTLSSGTGVGCYIFTGLTPGVPYSVSFTTPAGYSATTPLAGVDRSADSDPVNGITAPVTLTAGENNLTLDAGFVPVLGSIGDFVWKDANGNGIQDDGPNSGMSNVRVNLLMELSTPGQFTVVATTTTSTSGLYSFTGLSAGNYVVQVDVATVPFYCQPTTQTVVTPNDATNSKINDIGETPLIVINPADPNQRDYPKADAGFSPLPLGSIGNYVWKDTNNDGIQNDGSTGVPNVGLKLLDSDGTYILRGGLNGSQENPVVPTSGTGLVLAQFNPTTNEMVLNIGFNNLGGTVTMAHIHTGVTGMNGPVTIDLVPLGFPTGVQAGNFVSSLTLTAAQETLLLSNKLYVNVHTSTNSGGEVRAQLVACEFTDAAGGYLFDNLPEGTYKVAVDTPTLPVTCVVSTMQNNTVATDASDSDFDPTTGLSDLVTVLPMDPNNRNIRTVDLALSSPTKGSVGDLIWKDLVNDGRFDPATESGAAGVTVRLLEVTSPIGSTVISTSLVSSTVTGSDGKYLFTNLPAGRYIVEIDKTTLPASCSVSPKVRASGVPDGLNSDVDPITGRSPVVEINPNDPTTLTVSGLDVALVNPDCPDDPKCVPITIQRVR